MFGKRGGILSTLAAVGLLSGVAAQIPGAFTSGFDKSTELKATFPSKDIRAAATTTYTKATSTETVSCSTTAPPTGSGLPPASTGTTTHTVKVGGPGLLKYTPETVNATSGDTVFFDFLQVNHTLTQSTFDSPCVFMPGGARSGFRPNPMGTPGNQTFTFVVPDEKPKWFYCAQGTHCKSGMVFAINPGTKFPEFVSKAKGSGAAPSPSGSGAPPPPPYGSGTPPPPPYGSGTPPPPTSPPTGTGAPPASTGTTTHTVKVGGPGLLKYTPETVNATSGDTVFFDFLQVNHTLTQSTFDSPCVFLPGGARSGFRPNPLGTPGNQTFTFVVPDEKPKWFYCAQGNHCKSGMVFAINPGTKFPEFVEKAKGNANATATATAGTTITGVISNPTGTGVVTGSGVATGTKPTGTATGTIGGNGTASGAPVFSGDAVSGRTGFSLAAIAGVLLAALMVV